LIEPKSALAIARPKGPPKIGSAVLGLPLLSIGELVGAVKVRVGLATAFCAGLFGYKVFSRSASFSCVVGSFFLTVAIVQSVFCLAKIITFL
jgi:hypothetical protein